MEELKLFNGLNAFSSRKWVQALITKGAAAEQQLQHQLDIPTHFGGQIMSRFGPMIIAWADFTVISCSQCMPEEGGGGGAAWGIGKGRGVPHYHLLSVAINRAPPPLSPPLRTFALGTQLACHKVIYVKHPNAKLISKYIGKKI